MSGFDQCKPTTSTQTEEPGQDTSTHHQRLLVQFFLDEESSPIQATMCYDVDGPDEIEVLLGTFRTKELAMLAVAEAQYILARPRGYARVREAFKEAQRAALLCPGNLGLPEMASDSEFVERPTDAVADARKQRKKLVAEVLASAKFLQQRERAQRVTLSDKQVGSLLRKLIAASGNRLDRLAVATALGVPPTQLSGAIPMAQRLLNVEQFPVLSRDPDGVTIVLDVALMKEQFGVIE